MRGFFSGRGAVGFRGSDFRSLPFLGSFKGLACSCCCCTLLGPAKPVSSRKSQDMCDEDDGIARETLRRLGGMTRSKLLEGGTTIVVDRKKREHAAYALSEIVYTTELHSSFPRLILFYFSSTSTAIRCSTPFSFCTHSSSLVASPPICSRESTRGCTHEIYTFSSTWSNDPRISFRLLMRESFNTRHHDFVFNFTNLSAFMTRCSTSSTGSLVSSATVWKVIVRSFTGLLNTLSISAIRHIFCRKNI